MKIGTIRLLLDVESDAEAADAINEILREEQRDFAPASCLIDYAQEPQFADYDPPADSYEEGEAFPTPLDAAPLQARVSRLEAALRAIIAGSEVTGRWLDPHGAECGEDDPGAEWHEYDEDEQRIWLASVAGIAEKALLKGGSESEVKLDLQEVLTSLRQDHGLRFSDCVTAFARNRDSDPYARAAHKEYHQEGEIEIDDTTVVSEGGDLGAYVLAWVWVDDQAAGIVRDEDGEDEGGGRKRYTFPVTLSGVGKDADEAWHDAVEQFTLDPGEPDSAEVETGPGPFDEDDAEPIAKRLRRHFLRNLLGPPSHQKEQKIGDEYAFGGPRPSCVRPGLRTSLRGALRPGLPQ
jgi:hypothetical protein